MRGPQAGAMRWTMLAALALLLGSGCFDSPGGAFREDQDCSSSRQVVASASAEVLLPATMPDEAREPFGPLARVSVTAREGQTLQAVVGWVPSAGAVEVLFDGPRGNAAETDNGWMSTGVVEAGTYTLELAGAPMAFGVAYSLSLAAVGCTPRAP
jgi:hypothetical protein